MVTIAGMNHRGQSRNREGGGEPGGWSARECGRQSSRTELASVAVKQHTCRLRVWQGEPHMASDAGHGQSANQEGQGPSSCCYDLEFQVNTRLLHSPLLEVGIQCQQRGNLAYPVHSQAFPIPQVCVLFCEKMAQRHRFHPLYHELLQMCFPG